MKIRKRCNSVCPDMRFVFEFLELKPGRVLVNRPAKVCCEPFGAAPLKVKGHPQDDFSMVIKIDQKIPYRV